MSTFSLNEEGQELLADLHRAIRELDAAEGRVILLARGQSSQGDIDAAIGRLSMREAGIIGAVRLLVQITRESTDEIVNRHDVLTTH